MFMHTPEIPPDRIYEIIQSVEIFHVIDSALELGFFEVLKNPVTSHELARRTRTDPRLTEKICNLLVAIGFLNKKGPLYENSRLSNLYLVEGSPYCQKNLLKLERSIVKERWSKLSEALRSGPIKTDEEGKNTFSREFILAMAEGALRGDLQRTVKILCQLRDLKKAKKFLDLGGGHGLYAIALAQAFPDLHVYVLDLPHVIESTTKEIVDRWGMKERVHLISADFTKDEIGNDYDFIFASDVLYGKRLHLPNLLKKIYDSLNRDGIFASKHWYLNLDREGPLQSLLFDLLLSMYRREAPDFELFTSMEFISQLKGAGFVVEDVVDISSGISPSKIILARRC